MTVKEKTTTYYNKFSFLNGFQYFLATFIAILFGISLWQPFFYKVVWGLVLLLLLQVVISLLRVRLLNIILEIFMLILILPSLIPFLGVFAILIGLLIGLLEMATFKHMVLYKKVEVKTIHDYFGKGKKDKKSSKKKTNFKDVNFKEK